MTSTPSAGESLPPLSAEDHLCLACDLDFAAIDISDALTAISALPQEVHSTIAAATDRQIRRKPAPDVWSALEYVCHLRDVYATYTIRLHRARTEAAPAVEPMFSDLRALRFRYNQLDLLPVLGELENHVLGLVGEAATLGPEDWRRTVSRRPDEVRTAGWLVRQALHEGRHHLMDIRAGLAHVGAD